MRLHIKVGIIVAVLLGLYLTLPYFFGFATKHYFYRYTEHENPMLNNAFDVQVKIQRYHQGWFHSSAILSIQQKVNGVFQDWKTISVNITHGPLYRVHGRVAPGLGLLKSTESLTKATLPYDVSLLADISFNGDYTQFLSFKAKSAQIIPNAPQVQALLIRIRSHFKATDFDCYVVAKDLHFTDPTKSLTSSTKDLNVHVQADYLPNQHWKFVVGMDAHQGQLSMPMRVGQPKMMTLQFDRIQLNNLYLSTDQLTQFSKQLTELRQANAQAIANHQPMNPNWISWFQNIFSQLIQNDTQFKIHGMTLTTPYGKINLHFSLGFPRLLSNHDYFDAMMNAVGNLHLTIPRFEITGNTAKSTFLLTHFTYNNTSNTFLSSNADLGFASLDITPTNPQDSFRLSTTGFLYHTDAQGNDDYFKQAIQWSLNKFCVSKDCFNNIKGNLQFTNFNTKALRDIGNATQQLMQNHPNQPALLIAQWTNTMDAYEKLISSKTKITLSHTLTSPKGEVVIQGALSWPTLSQAKTSAKQLVDDADYELHVVFPAAYIDEFLAQANVMDQVAAKASAVTQPQQESASPETTTPEASLTETLTKQSTGLLRYLIQNNYVQKTNNAYVLDLKGHGLVFTMNGKPWSPPPAVTDAQKVPTPVSTSAPVSTPPAAFEHSVPSAQ